MYKLSKYTYLCRDSGDLLAYNSYHGVSSLCNIADLQSQIALENNQIYNIQDEIREALIDKGILVEKEVDEDKLLHSYLLRITTPHCLGLTINPTEMCNLRCTYCYECHESGIMSNEVQEQILRYIAINIKYFSGVNISWFGGEPLLQKEILKHLSVNIMDICNKNKRKYSAGITTNAYLLDVDTFTELLNLQIKNFQITIDGIQEIHDRQRVLANGKGTFDRIIKNLEDIRRLRRSDFSITLRTNFTNEMYLHMDEYLRMISQLFGEDERFSIAFFSVKDIEGTANVDIKSSILDNKKNPMRRIYESILNSKYKVNLKKEFLNPGRGMCYAAKHNNYVITSDGTIHKCTIDMQKDSSTVAEFARNRIIHNNNYCKYIADYRKCDKINECFLAPVCTGNPCPLKDADDYKCTYLLDNIDLYLKILNKNEKFERIG